MKPIINYETYEKDLNKVIYHIDFRVLLLALVLSFFYELYSNFSGVTQSFFSLEVLSSIFFHGVMIWAGIYLIKKLGLTGMIRRAFNTHGVTDPYDFYPCFYSTSLINSKFGNIFIENERIFFYANRVSKNPIQFESTLSNVEISVLDEPHNYLAKILWGSSLALVLKDKPSGKTAKFLTPNSEAIKDALLEYLEPVVTIEEN